MQKVFILFLIVFLVSFNLDAGSKHSKVSNERDKAPGLVNKTQNSNKMSITKKRQEIIQKLYNKHKSITNNHQANTPLLSPAIKKNSTSDNSLNKPNGVFISYPAYGFSDSYNVDEMYHRGFPLNQISPMTNAYPPHFLDKEDFYMWGGTTANWGLGLVSGWDDFNEEFFLGGVYRGAYFIDNIMDPYWERSKDGDYWPVELAFDHTTNTLYILYFYLDYMYYDYPMDPGSIQKKVSKPNSILSGFYLAKFNVSLAPTGYHIALTEIPSAGSAVPLYITSLDPWDMGPHRWEHLYMGLACNRAGQLYTIDYATDDLCSIDKNTGIVTPIGPVDIDLCNDFDDYWWYVDEFINMEFDHTTNKLYCIEANDWVWDGDSEYYSDLYELNPLTGGTFWAGDAPGAQECLWTPDGGGPGKPGLNKPNGMDVNTDHYVTSFQIPICGVFLAAPNPLSEFFAHETSTVKAGETYDIKWFAYNVNNRVKLEYSSDNGTTWYLIADQVYTVEIPGYIESYFDLVNPNSYTWLVPTGLPSEIKIKVSKASDPFFWDANILQVTSPIVSNRGRLIITAPNGGEKFIGGTYRYIEWKKINGQVAGPFRLEYTTNEGSTWNRIVTPPIAGINRYSWHVPEINAPHCKVRILNYYTGVVYDVSDNCFSIQQQASAANFPNPFNPSTKICFTLEKAGLATLKVFNSLGQQVTELVNKPLETGYHEFDFNAQTLPSGIYYYELRCGERIEVNKMMLIK